jgi:hypothetical protein
MTLDFILVFECSLLRSHPFRQRLDIIIRFFFASDKNCRKISNISRGAVSQSSVPMCILLHDLFSMFFISKLVPKTVQSRFTAIIISQIALGQTSTHNGLRSSGLNF